MPRRRAEDRLETICEAALNVFTARGYQRARMVEIAEAAGVAPGTLYLYVESKEALFLLVVEWLSLRESLPTTFPVPTPPPGETLRVLHKGLDKSTRLRTLERMARSRRAVDIVQEFSDVVDELYSVIHENRRLIALVDRCSIDWPELHEAWVVRDRQRFHRRIAAYIEQRISAKQIKPVADVNSATWFLIESAGWMAWKRMDDLHQSQLDDASLRESVRTLLVRAFTLA